MNWLQGIVVLQAHGKLLQPHFDQHGGVSLPPDEPVEAACEACQLGLLVVEVLAGRASDPNPAQASAGSKGAVCGNGHHVQHV